MDTTKSLFDAIEISLKTARIAISDADRFLDAIKEELEAVAARAKSSEGINMETVFNCTTISTGKEKEEIGEFLKRSI